jgi:hypothetical protein
MIVSQTAYCNGWGSDPWKTCAGLTKSERQAVRNGETVIFVSERLSNGNSGTKLRIAFVDSYGWKRRVPSADEIAEYNNLVAQTK